MESLFHRLLVALAAKSPQTIGELYQECGRHIKPERAARRYDADRSRLTMEERIYKGRMAIIVNCMRSLVENKHAVENVAPKTRCSDPTRSWRITDLGVEKAKSIQDNQPRQGIRRLSDPVVLDGYRLVLDNVKMLLSTDWVDRDEFRSVATSDVTREQAIAAYRFYSRASKGKWSEDKIVELGKNNLMDRALHHLDAERERRDGRVFVRSKTSSEFPRLLSG